MEGGVLAVVSTILALAPYYSSHGVIKKVIETNKM